MSRRPAGERRFLGLWTAGCLAVLLFLGVTWVGDWSVQWPVLLVPLAWALVALRPRRGARGRTADQEDGGTSFWDGPDHWGEGQNPYSLPPGGRTDTVERPSVRDQRGRRQG